MHGSTISVILEVCGACGHLMEDPGCPKFNTNLHCFQQNNYCKFSRLCLFIMVMYTTHLLRGGVRVGFLYNPCYYYVLLTPDLFTTYYLEKI